MAETIAKTGVKREAGLLYYIGKDGNVWASPLKKAGAPKGKATKVAETAVERDYSKFMYFVKSDNSGELVVARTSRQVGGSKRAKSGGGGAKKASSGGAKKAAPKKAASAKKAAPKKAAPAKKAAPKKAPAKKGKKK